MKILYIITRGDLIGGAQIHVRDCASALLEAGHEPYVLSGSTGDFTRQLSGRGISWEHIPELTRNIQPLRDLRAVSALRRVIRRIHPDIISTHTAKAGMAGRIAGILEKRPVMFTAHGWQFADGIPARQALPVLFIEKILSRHTERIITVSEYDFRLAVRKKAATAEKMLTIHNGLPYLPPCERSDRNAGPARLVMIARFQPQKDHKTLILALETLEDLDWTIQLVGDGPDMEAAQQAVEKAGLNGRVEFSGQRNDIAALLEESDVYVLASHWEGFPRSIIEAMRASLPVVCNDVGGCGEAVENGETGFLVKENDHAGLAEALRTLITNPECARRMGLEGRKRFERFFTFDRMIEKTISVYSEISNRYSRKSRA